MNQNEQPILPNPLEAPAAKPTALKRALAITALTGVVAGGGLVADQLNQDTHSDMPTSISSPTKFGSEATPVAAEDPIAHPQFVNQSKPTDTTINIGDSGIKFGNPEGEVKTGTQTPVSSPEKPTVEAPAEQPVSESIDDIGILPPVKVERPDPAGDVGFIPAIKLENPAPATTTEPVINQ